MMTATPPDPKTVLHRYLRVQRDHLLAKLDGLGERELRWPMTPTGTNLLGLVKHVASVQLGYFGDVFDRPHARDLPWFDDDAEINADLWATADETREDILDLYDYSAAHSDATIDSLDLDAPGHVPWWGPDREQVTLHQILVHMVVEIARHAGHADIIREMIDGSAGNDDGNLPEMTAAEWAAYRERLERAAEESATRRSGP
jgi:uncharacterized damage-inducible protein DinB